MMGTHRGRAGFSLVELIFALAISTVFLTMIAEVAGSSEGLTSSTLTLGRIEEAGNNATFAIASEVRWSQPDTTLITAENGSDRLDLVVATGVNGTEPIWSTPITYRYEPTPLDGNGNGALDEGVLVRIQAGRRRVLCRNVAFGGFAVTRDGSRVDLSLTVFGLSGESNLLERTISTSTSFVNQPGH